MLPGLDAPEVPVMDLTTCSGSVIPYKPDALLNTKFYLHKAWRYTRRPRA